MHEIAGQHRTVPALACLRTTQKERSWDGEKFVMEAPHSHG